jgi:hypothetical protein
MASFQLSLAAQVGGMDEAGNGDNLWAKQRTNVYVLHQSDTALF